MAKRKIKLLDTVALANDLPERKLKRGEVGTVVEILAPDVFEVEFSDDDGQTYAELALRDDQLKVAGVPRHERAWIETIVEETKHDLPPFDRYIFVVSRPAITDYLTPEKKRRALEDIRKLAFEDLDCKVVVKLHPTERVAKNKDTLYEEVFGRDTYGKQWIYSSVHPFALGNKSLFAVVFYSGVAVDMIALGVVPIERLEVDTAPELAEATREMIKDYRKRGLVLPAENYEDLKRHALAIIKNKEAVLERLKPGYKEFFGTTEDPIKLVADDIVAVLQ